MARDGCLWCCDTQTTARNDESFKAAVLAILCDVLDNGVPVVGNQQYTFRYDYDGSGNVIYSGYAPVGTLSSAVTWELSAYTYSGSNVTLIARGTGSWDGRAAVVYS